MRKRLWPSLVIAATLYAPGLTVSVLDAAPPAASYYVDAALGNDANAGTLAAPWKTLAKVTAGHFNPGDTVYFKRGGMWNERLGLSSSGSAGKPITYTAYGSGTAPTFYGTTPVANNGWTDDGGGKYHKDIGSSVCIALYEDGIGIPQATSTALANPALGPRWFLNGTVLYYAPTSGTPAAHTLDRLNQSTGIYATATPRSYVTLDGLRLWHSSQIYLATSASAGGGGWDHITIQNMVFEDQPQGILGLQRSNNFVQAITVLNNTFVNVGYAAYFTASGSAAGFNNDGIVFTGNTISKANKTVSGGYWAQTGDRDGAGFQNISNTVIEGNEISGGCPAAGAIGIWLDPTSTTNFTGNAVRHNYLHDLDYHGIYYDAGVAPASQHSVDISSNVIAHYSKTVAGGGGIRLNSPQGTMRSTVTNNILYDGANGLHLNSGPNNYDIRGNVVSAMSLALARADAPLGANVLSGNTYGSGEVGSPFNIGGVAKTWAQWQAAYGEAGSMMGDPTAALVNAAGIGVR